MRSSKKMRSTVSAVRASSIGATAGLDVVAFIDVLVGDGDVMAFAFAVMGPPEIDLTLPIGP